MAVNDGAIISADILRILAGMLSIPVAFETLITADKVSFVTNYSRQSQFRDAAVRVNRAQQQPLRRANKSLRRSRQSSLTY